MNERKWFDSSQPQTLQSAVLLSYVNAALALFYTLVSRSTAGTLTVVLLGAAVGAYGIANEKKWGYWLCLVCASLYLLFWVLIVVNFGLSLAIVINLMFALILVVLLTHPMSRSYRRTWFR
jgi:uncharacterized membrane protein (DUF2068 family)